MPIIEFNTWNEDAFNTTKPVPAHTMQPDWWKKGKSNEIVNGNAVTGTIKICPAMRDWLTTGYLIVSQRDIQVRHDKELMWHRAEVERDSDEKQIALPSHPKEQLFYGTDHEFNMFPENPNMYDAFKIRCDWCMKLPEGYSMMYLDPFLYNNPDFVAWRGMIDADKGFNMADENNNIIMYPKHDGDFVIKKGTPLVQVVPYKREEWTAQYNLKTPQEWFEDTSPTLRTDGKIPNGTKVTTGEGNYKKDAWSQKKPLYKDAEGGCPFGHDNPKKEIQMEMDFKQEQLKQTDLNWDGQDVS